MNTVKYLAHPTQIPNERMAKQTTENIKTQQQITPIHWDGLLCSYEDNECEYQWKVVQWSESVGTPIHLFRARHPRIYTISTAVHFPSIKWAHVFVFVVVASQCCSSSHFIIIYICVQTRSCVPRTTTHTHTSNTSRMVFMKLDHKHFDGALLRFCFVSFRFFSLLLQK